MLVKSRAPPPPPRQNLHMSLVVIIVMMASSILITTNSNANEEQNHRRHQVTSTHRKSLVFDLKTPKVFYCPQEKPSDYDKIIVKAQPLEKLCEFEGKQKPKGLSSDCYNDLDESEFACDEKRRFMIKLDLASEGVSPSVEGIDDLDYIMTKSSQQTKKKASPKGKKY